MPILAQKFFVDKFVKLFDTLNYAKKIQSYTFCSLLFIGTVRGIVGFDGGMFLCSVFAAHISFIKKNYYGQICNNIVFNLCGRFFQLLVKVKRQRFALDLCTRKRGESYGKSHILARFRF